MPNFGKNNACSTLEKITRAQLWKTLQTFPDMTGPHYCMHDKNSRLYWLVFIDRSLNFTYNIAEVNGDSREGFGGNPSLLNEILGHRSEAQRSVQRWTKTTFTHADEKRVCNLPAALQQRQLGFDTYATFSLWCSSDSLPLSLWRSSNSLPWEQLIEQLLTLPLLLEVVLGPLLHQWQLTLGTAATAYLGSSS